MCVYVANRCCLPEQDTGTDALPTLTFSHFFLSSLLYPLYSPFFLVFFLLHIKIQIAMSLILKDKPEFSLMELR